MLGNVCWIYVLDPPPKKPPKHFPHFDTLCHYFDTIRFIPDLCCDLMQCADTLWPTLSCFCLCSSVCFT